MKPTLKASAFTLVEVLISVTLVSAIIAAGCACLILCLHVRARQFVQEFPEVECQRAVMDIQYAISHATFYTLSDEITTGTGGNPEWNTLELNLPDGSTWKFSYDPATRSLTRCLGGTAPSSTGTYASGSGALDGVQPAASHQGLFMRTPENATTRPANTGSNGAIASGAGMLNAAWNYVYYPNPGNPNDTPVTTPYSVHAYPSALE